MSIEAVEGLCPSLRYSSLFPPCPMLDHNPIGYNDSKSSKKKKHHKTAGVLSTDPIHIQIRFESCTSKWPTDVNAMGAAKCALLTQIADGLDTELKLVVGSKTSSSGTKILVTPLYMDVPYRGYCFRVSIRPNEELILLENLKSPTKEALELKRVLLRKHIISASHHTTIHAINTRHPAASATTRLAQRWLHAHMLSGLIPLEALELLVAKVFTLAEEEEDNKSDISIVGGSRTPGSAFSGFLRFLQLLVSHDWVRQPLIVDPQHHLTDIDVQTIHSQFEMLRGKNKNGGPPMFLISSHDKPNRTDKKLKVGVTSTDTDVWMPTYTRQNPERMVLARAVELAKRSYDHLIQTTMSCCDNKKKGNEDDAYAAIFRENSSSLQSYSVLLRADHNLIVDPDCSSMNRSNDGSLLIHNQSENSGADLHTPFSRSMERLAMGHKFAQKKLYRNVEGGDAVLYGWQPIRDFVQSLRHRYKNYAVFFYNELAPDVIGILWRPTVFTSQSYSAMTSEYKCPVVDKWQADSLVICNSEEILGEIKTLGRDLIVDVKILDDRSVKRKHISEHDGNDCVNGVKVNDKHKKIKGVVVEDDSSSGSSSDDDSDSDS
eukprot:CAMPEP_0171298618 /NCGR_PEP_ID=MMETSP0816-20121228/7389_1 /TAXON_ID=420281 /ORGANISM="Proboscia inermis, Strain CCAP1064/1" /LENGTH=602 /DNA_ID=CAMNT_0011773785 /DNA_START=26 /DNA_END=1834 /DNA_ORIENTATION=-